MLNGLFEEIYYLYDNKIINILINIIYLYLRIVEIKHYYLNYFFLVHLP